MPSHFIDLVLCNNHTSSCSSYMPDVMYSDRIYMHNTLICVICQAVRLINHAYKCAGDWVPRAPARDPVGGTGNPRIILFLIWRPFHFGGKLNAWLRRISHDSQRDKFLSVSCLSPVLE